jgi:hypothetical protein
MSTLTVLDVKTRVKRKFGDESGVQLTDADILRYINDSQRKIVMRNDSLLEKSSTANTQAGIQEYSFPIDMLKFKSLKYKGTGDIAYRPMQGMTLNELDLYVDSWDSNVSSLAVPIMYAVHAGKFQVYPVPQDTVANAFKVYYCRKPTDMVLDADVIDLPELYHDTVVDLVLQDAYEMDEDWNAAAAKSAQTNQSIDRLKDSDEWTKRDTYPVITVRPEDL